MRQEASSSQKRKRSHYVLQAYHLISMHKLSLLPPPHPRWKDVPMLRLICMCMVVVRELSTHNVEGQIRQHDMFQKEPMHRLRRYETLQEGNCQEAGGTSQDCCAYLRTEPTLSVPVNDVVDPVLVSATSVRASQPAWARPEAAAAAGRRWKNRSRQYQ